METVGTLKPVAPYNLSLTLSLLSRYTHPALDVAHKGAYWRLLSCKGGLALVRIKDVGKPKKPRVEVSLAMSTVVPDTDDLMKKVKTILGADIDPNPFYDAARQHDRLWQIVKPLKGLRWLNTETMFEALMMTIIEQQIAWTAAQRAQRWLVEWGGHTLRYKDRAYFAFPRPRQIANASIDDLRPLKITFRRMQTMIDIAGQVADGSLNLEKLRKKSPEKAYKKLVALNGIGHWTATWTLQRTLPHHNYVGHNDVALQAAVGSYFYGKDGKVSPEQVQETFAPLGDYAGLAANYTMMRYVLDRYASNGAM